tara:strand:- start:1608 stop:1925 length:318 start_codon:yes stop_codon:yes gene_type:complete
MVSRAIKRARAVALMPFHSSHEKVFISQLSREQKVVDVAPKTPESDSVTSEVSATVADSETVEAAVVAEEPAVDASAPATEEAEEAATPVVTSEETNVEEKPSES